MRIYENSFLLFAAALEYIESNLTSELSQEDIACACCASLSSLQKTWRYCTHMSLGEYITKRRIALAGRDLLGSDISVLDCAMKYGYNSHEVFTRAFAKVWGIPPIRFKKKWKGGCVLHPMLNPEYVKGADSMNIMKFDVSEFYDYLKSQAGTYVLCFDIVNLMPVNNELGREAGDKVILEAFRRINEASEDNMLCLRIGGDEFVMITESTDRDKITAIAEKILAQNGEKTAYSGGEVAVSLTCGTIVIGKSLRYSVLCEDFNEVIIRAKKSGRIEFK